MSLRALDWALYVPVSGTDKVVLLGLANHANDEGHNTYPSIGRLAVYGACDTRTVQRALRRLVKNGWIENAGLAPGGVNRYRLCMELHEHRDAMKCVYCTGEARARDHVVPRSKGGGKENNIVPVCHGCNRSKGDSDVREWVERNGLDWAEVADRLAYFGVDIAALSPGGGNLPLWHSGAGGDDTDDNPSDPEGPTGVSSTSPKPSVEPSATKGEEGGGASSEPEPLGEGSLVPAPTFEVPPLPAWVDPLLVKLDGTARQVGGRFGSAWIMERAMVARTMAAESEQVAEAAVDLLNRQALAGWNSLRVSPSFSGWILDRARRQASAKAKRSGSRAERPTEGGGKYGGLA